MLTVFCFMCVLLCVQTDIMAADSHGNRVRDIAFEDGAPRAPLAGLFPKDLPIPTLEAAAAHRTWSAVAAVPTPRAGWHVGRRSTRAPPATRDATEH